MGRCWVQVNAGLLQGFEAGPCGVRVVPRPDQCRQNTASPFIAACLGQYCALNIPHPISSLSHTWTAVLWEQRHANAHTPTTHPPPPHYTPPTHTYYKHTHTHTHYTATHKHMHCTHARTHIHTGTAKKHTGRDIIQNKDMRAHIDTPPDTFTGTQSKWRWRGRYRNLRNGRSTKQTYIHLPLTVWTCNLLSGTPRPCAAKKSRSNVNPCNKNCERQTCPER